MEIPRHWRLKKQRYGLVGDICAKGHPAFPPDNVCKHCDPAQAIKQAIVKTAIKTESESRDIKAKIVIYEADPDKYQSLDEIKI